MGSTAKRTWVIEEGWDPETGEGHGHYDREQALACMEEVEHLLYMVGGMVSFAADRVQVGELGDEPLAVSRRLVVTWSSYSPMRRDEAGSDFASSDEAPESAQADEPEPVYAGPIDLDAPENRHLRSQVGRPAEEDDDEDEPDRTLTTAGTPRPDADL